MDFWTVCQRSEWQRDVFNLSFQADEVYRKGGNIVRTLLNIITAISITSVILTGCMLDSESMIPAYICGISVLVLGLTCMVRERL